MKENISEYEKDESGNMMEEVSMFSSEWKALVYICQPEAHNFYSWVDCSEHISGATFSFHFWHEGPLQRELLKSLQ